MSGRLGIELAHMSDVTAIHELVIRAFDSTIRAYYSQRQLVSAKERFCKIDRELIEAGTYYVARDQGAIVGCGGWSRRRELVAHAAAPSLRASVALASPGAATLRSFFVDPGHVRRGIAAQIFQLCMQDVRAAGYRRLELLAAASSVEAFVKLGFGEILPVDLSVDEHTELSSFRMGMNL